MQYHLIEKEMSCRDAYEHSKRTNKLIDKRRIRLQLFQIWLLIVLPLRCRFVHWNRPHSLVCAVYKENNRFNLLLWIKVHFICTPFYSQFLIGLWPLVAWPHNAPSLEHTDLISMFLRNWKWLNNFHNWCSQEQPKF